MNFNQEGKIFFFSQETENIIKTVKNKHQFFKNSNSSDFKSVRSELLN